MNSLKDTTWIELRKAIRSRMPFYTALGFLMMPLVDALMIFIYRNPELSLKLGLISAKANIIANSATDWPAYLKLIDMSVAIAGFFLFCLITSWMFGREFSDGTLKDLLAVPVPRASILLAKFIVVATWCAVLTAIIYVVGLLMGAILDLPQGSSGVIWQGSAHLAITVCLVIGVALPFAFFASVGRGYLLPLGVAIMTIIVANLLVVAGWGEYFPWSIPGLFSQGEKLIPISYVIVVLTGLAGMLGTYMWWMLADQSR
jgi:ABC-2 type transport system permease protein